MVKVKVKVYGLRLRMFLDSSRRLRVGFNVMKA
jgi:hypothetical protein